MPTADLPGAQIYYEIVGEDGPWVVVIQGGRHPLEERSEFASAVADRGFRVLLHDRRNCGRSSLDFETETAEDDIWVDDLRTLLGHLGIRKPLLVGSSRGARIAVKFVLQHPRSVSGLLLWSVSGGALALRFLDNYYYGQYLRSCAVGGMEAVCELEHFAGLIHLKPSRQQTLLAIDPSRFAAVLNRWRESFLVDADQPFMGMSSSSLASVSCPTFVVAPFGDPLHPLDSAFHAHRMIPRSHFVALGAEHTETSAGIVAVGDHLVGFYGSLRGSRWRRLVSPSLQRTSRWICSAERSWLEFRESLGHLHRTLRRRTRPV